MKSDPSALVNFALSRGGTHAVVKLINTLNEFQSVRKAARHIGMHESQLSRLTSRIVVRTYTLNPDLREVFEKLKDMEEAEYERSRHRGLVLPLKSPGDKG